MKGGDIVKLIQENHAEDAEIYIRLDACTMTQSECFEVLHNEDCPCMDLIVLR